MTTFHVCKIVFAHKIGFEIKSQKTIASFPDYRTAYNFAEYHRYNNENAIYEIYTKSNGYQDILY